MAALRFVHNGVQPFAGADAERPRKRNQHIHIGDAASALQCGNGTLADFGVVSKLLLGQPRGIPVAPENHGHDVFCDFSPFIFHSPFVAFFYSLSSYKYSVECL